MSVGTATETPKADTEQRQKQLPAIAAPRLPYHPAIQERFGIDMASWRALVEAVFPNASSINSVIMALSYCRARKLDPFKRVVHIVPIWNRDLKRLVDTIWPGIGELRTTAFRTSEYAGRDRTEFGPDITRKVGSVEMTFPEWAQVTVYRIIKGQRVGFAGPQVYWLETYATAKRDDDSPNDMWKDRPRGQIDKCAEAAALRAAFPEEIGGEYIPEEVQHSSSTVVEAAPAKSLDDLADEIEALDRGTEPAEKLSEGEIDPSRPEEEQFVAPKFDLALVKQQFDAANTLTAINEISKTWPNSSVPEEHRAAMGGMETEARERISAARTKRQTAGAT